MKYIIKNKTMKNKVIFWDWTGTLADESKLDKAVCFSMEKELAKRKGISFDQATAEYNRYLKQLENTWGWHDYVEHSRELGIDWRKCQEINLPLLELVPGAEAILINARNKGYKNILATNAVRQVILLRIHYTGLESLFDLIIGSDDANALKALGSHFDKGIEYFNADAKVSFSIGDNPIQDIRSANKLDLKTVFCAYGRHLTHYHSDHISDNHFEKEKPDHSIKSLSELDGII